MENDTGEVESGGDTRCLIYPWRKEPDALMFVCLDRGLPLIASCGKCGEDCPDYSEQVQPL